MKLDERALPPANPRTVSLGPGWGLVEPPAVAAHSCRSDPTGAVSPDM